MSQHDYYEFIAKRRAASSSAAWDGRERRADYRHGVSYCENTLNAQSLDTKTVFREMIVHEIKNGRLSSWRRKRIVRYAAKMGLSAVEAGKLLAECRDQAMSELQAGRKTPQLRVRAPETDDNTTANRVVLAIMFAILVNAALMLIVG